MRSLSKLITHGVKTTKSAPNSLSNIISVNISDRKKTENRSIANKLINHNRSNTLYKLEIIENPIATLYQLGE